MPSTTFGMPLSHRKNLTCTNFRVASNGPRAIIDCVVIGDDIIQYICESLTGIASRNPASPGTGKFRRYATLGDAF